MIINYSITIKQKLKNREEEWTSKLMIIDLAGAEILGEKGLVNVSLTFLGNVVSKICQGKKAITFRETLLTRLLQPSFQGYSQIILLFCLNPFSSKGANSSVNFAYNIMRLPKIQIKTNLVKMNEEYAAIANQELIELNMNLKEQLKIKEKEEVKNKQYIQELENKILKLLNNTNSELIINKNKINNNNEKYYN